MQSTFQTKSLQIILIAFAFKSLASIITIYAIVRHTAIEIAPTSALFISKLGVISADIIVNMIWLGATIAAFYIIQNSIQDHRLKQTTFKISAIVIISFAAVDGLWDFAVLTEFNWVYLIAIAFLMIISLTYTFVHKQDIWHFSPRG